MGGHYTLVKKPEEDAKPREQAQPGLKPVHSATFVARLKPCPYYKAASD
jgi:hypothetical protein